MARYTGPKHKLARKAGVNVLEKQSASLDRRLNIPPGIHGRKGRRKSSEYALQLREKQKLKSIYGLLEKQFRKYVLEAQRRKINTEDVLVQLLETRLDNIVFRLGFAHSRAQARQFVTHRHVLVNGKRVNIPSFAIQPGDTITLSDKLSKQEVLKEHIDEKSEILEFLNKKDTAGKLIRLPNREDVANPINYQLVIEFYSR